MTDYKTEAEQIASEHCPDSEVHSKMNGRFICHWGLAATIAEALEAAEKRGRIAGLREADEMTYQTHLATLRRIEEVGRE